MAGYINEATILGNLTKDPDVRSMQDGKEIASLSIATNESWRDKGTGEKREAVEYHRVTIFNEKLAGIAKQYLRKGSKVLVRGAIKTRKWADNSGMERYSTEIVLQGFDAKLVLLDGKQADQQAEQRETGKQILDRVSDMGWPDDSIPF